MFVTLSCALLSFEDIASLQFSYGSLFILLACVCWGFENNCTRKISFKDPQQIVLLKGIFSGLGSLVIGLIIGERVTVLWSVFAVLGVGFVAYGLSIFFYVYAQRYLGAARTSAYYAVAPFLGTALSLIIFRDMPITPISSHWDSWRSAHGSPRRISRSSSTAAKRVGEESKIYIYR